MATPLTLDQLRRAYDLWGVPHDVFGHPDAFHRPGRWGNVRGIVKHHTGVTVSDDRDLRVITQGRPDLPPPLCHNFIGDDAVVTIVSTGRANHAGKGAMNTYRALTSEQYAGMIKPGPDVIDFNAITYGDELGYAGDDMGAQRYQVSLLADAARCHAHGWTAKSVISHAELTHRKWDLGRGGRALDMSVYRSDVQTLLDRGPKACTTTVATARPQSTTARNGRISATVLRDHQKGWSAARYKEVALAAHGPLYRAAARRRWGKALTSPVWDNCAKQLTRDLYASLDRSRPGQGWGSGDTSVPGRKLLTQILGFEVV